MNVDNAVFIQAVRGPLMLITLGILVAYDHFSGPGFSRTWPILIIVFGGLKLLERVAAARSVNPGGGLQ